MFVGRYRMFRSLKETREHKKELIRTVKDYGIKNNIPVKCESDQVLLYIRFMLDSMEERRKCKLDEDFKEIVYKIHKETRGNHMEIGVLIPSTLACAILHMAARLYKLKTKRKIITQKDIGDTIDMGMQQSRITDAFRKLDAFFQKKNIPYPDIEDD